MPNRKMAQPWARQLAVAAGYGAGYSLFHDVLLTQYSLSFGFRFAVLTLTPYRYWSALFLGELLSSGFIAVACVPDFGAQWALLRAVPMIVLSMPVVYLCRERLRLVSTRNVNVPILVFAALAAGLITVPSQVGLYSLADLPAGSPSPQSRIFLYFVMNFVGALTVAPVVLCVRNLLAGAAERSLLTQITENRLVIESFGMLLPVLAFLLWLGFNALPNSETRHIVQMAMFLPVIALTLRHGWYGAAIGGAVSGVAVEMLMPSAYDDGGMQAQALIALANSTMLLMGRHITVLNQREQEDRAGLRLALASAQQNYHLGELQFRRVAATLIEMQRSLYRVFHFGRQLAPAQSLEYERTTRPLVRALEDLANHLDPFSSRRRSMPAALRESGMARALGDHRVQFDVVFRGSISALTHELHLVLYRLIADAVHHICDSHRVSSITVMVACRRCYGRTWLSVCIDGIWSDEAAVGLPWTDLLERLEHSSRSSDFAVIEFTARSYGGRARIRTTSSGRRITALLDAS